MARRGTIALIVLVALGLVLILTILVAVSRGATSAAANRCLPTKTSSSLEYHCWSAYPEAFYVAGYTSSRYRIDWKVTCSGQPVSGSKSVRFAYKVIVNQFTNQRAYQLMITNNVCKVDVVATRTSGNSSIAMELFINQNHPAPGHN